MSKAVLLTPQISTGGRSVYAKGRSPAPFIWGLLLIPTIAFAIAVADSRIGFKLFMASLGITMLVLVLALFFRSRALQTGKIRIAASGGLQFVPSGSIPVGAATVAVAFLLPGAASLIISALDLPTQQGLTRFTTVAPYALALFGLWSLVQVALSPRVPVGLRVGPDGLTGVRGTKRVDLGWDDLESATAFGHHGTKLMLLTKNESTVIIDSHHIGSDPAIVARVIEHFKANPTQRAQLSDGVAAVEIVETVS